MPGIIISSDEITPIKDGKYWRVRVRRLAKGVNIGERFNTEAEAQAYISSTVTPLLSKGEIPLSSNSKRLTFGQLADQFLAQTVMMDLTGDRPLKPSSVTDRKVRLKVLKGIFGKYKLNTLAPRLIEQEIGKQKWNPQNRQKYESAMNQLFEWGRSARSGRPVAANPMRSVERASGSSRKLKRVYRDEEWAALLSAADEESVPIGLFLRLLRATGLRKGELLSLLWENVAASDRKGLGASLYLPTTKSHEERTVFIKPDTYRLLLAYEQQHRREGEPRVFTLKVDTIFRKVREKAKLDQPNTYGEYLTIHAIRRTFATQLGKRGATLAQMRAAGGWKTAEQAMRYMQVTEDLAAEAALLAGD